MKDVIIVGAGLMGSALAHQCARLGLDTMLIEAGSAGGAGATAHSRGIVRVYDPHPELMSWAARGVREWSNWTLPGPSPFVACGLYYCVRQANREASLAALSGHDHAQYPIHVLPASSPALPPELRHLVEAGGIVLHEPLAGYVDTRLAARLFVQSAKEHGAQVLEGSTVLRVGADRESAQVMLAHATLRARRVVLAAGAATPSLAQVPGMYCRSIPLSSVRSPAKAVPAHCIIDEVSGGYIRPDGSEFLFAGGALQHDAASHQQLFFDLPGAGARNAELAQHLTGTQAMQLLDTRPGYDGYTPDFLPHIGPSPDDQRIVLATGFSGRGAKYIPAVAVELARQLAAKSPAGVPA
jgi:glycine/D-amino acid oxidase-like deaminating enzyme